MRVNKVIFGTDHAGYELKEVLIAHLRQRGVEVEDMGCHSGESCDYPDFCRPAAERAVAENASAVVLGGSGQGEAIVANKVPGARAAVINCENMDLVELSRTHNDANVLSFGARFVTPDFACKALDTWLGTEFEGGRHQRRIDKIESLD